MDPTTVTVVVLVVLLLVVVAVVALVVRRRKERERRAHLQERFGGEYDRAVAGGDTRGAEARLAQAERDRERLQVQPLSAEQRRRRTAQWQAVQADFVEVPVEAVDAAAGLVREVMTERGYPERDDDHAITMLAADHAETVEHYRSAEAHRARFSSGEGSTEDLRRAFVEYRRLFDVLVEEGADRRDPADDSSFVDGSTRPDGTPMTADDYVRQQQATSPRADADASDASRPAGQHAARHEVDVRDERDPAPSPTPVDGGATRTDRP